MSIKSSMSPIETHVSTGIPTSGKLPISMTNDYLFRALLQENNKALTGLIASLLYLSPAEIQSVEIMNPIELGKSIDDKTFILDIRILLNSSTHINLEMQVINHHNWQDRSLSYLCREFDQLSAGDDYDMTRPVIQIGILNYTLFPDAPEFYTTYELLNVKTFTKYSDKLRLSVLDLTQIALATEEDKQYQIDYWASLFKATTWEELNMLAQNNEYIGEAVKTVHTLSEEEMIKEQCRARAEYYNTMARIDRTMKEQQEQLEVKNIEISAKNAEISAKNIEINVKNAEISALQTELENLRNQLATLSK